MGKKSRPRRLPRDEAQAVARNLRVSPRKLNLVAALVRGKPAARALAELTFSRKGIAREVKKTLESAIANAENNHNLDVDRLVVAHAHVGRSFALSRWRAGPKGRGMPRSRPYSHLTVVVREVRAPARRPAAGGARAKTAAKAAGSKAAAPGAAAPAGGEG